MTPRRRYMFLCVCQLALAPLLGLYPQAYTASQLRSLRRAPGRLDHRPVQIVVDDAHCFFLRQSVHILYTLVVSTVEVAAPDVDEPAHHEPRRSSRQLRSTRRARRAPLPRYGAACLLPPPACTAGARFRRREPLLARATADVHRGARVTRAERQLVVHTFGRGHPRQMPRMRPRWPRRKPPRGTHQGGAR